MPAAKCFGAAYSNGIMCVTGKNIEIDRNGDIVVLTNYYGGTISKRINLIKLRPDGELIWKKDYATIEDHPYIWNSQANSLMISESNDYYITGRPCGPPITIPRKEADGALSL
jgi:hypothetical protein